MDAHRRRCLHALGAAAALAPLGLATRALAAPSDLPASPASWWRAGAASPVTCELCPHGCATSPGGRGRCGVRENRDGRYVTLVHSRPAAVHTDPIEKKPLFHFRPGGRAFSLATVGCNLDCRFCQNWELSQARPEDAPVAAVPPEEIVRQALAARAEAIAFTYSEPTVFAEYLRDICVAARGTGLGRVIISNGFIAPAAHRELLGDLDAQKIDFKSFSEGFYREICGGRLRPVLDSLVRVRESGVWLELVMLVVPSLNDDPRMIAAMARWIAQKLGPDVPIHFTRFHPMYKLKNLTPTPVATLERARRIALDAGLRYAYAGNVPGHPGENTWCPACGQVVIARDGFTVAENRLVDGRCPCGQVIPGRWR